MDKAHSLFRNCFCSEMQMISEGRHYVQEVFFSLSCLFLCRFPLVLLTCSHSERLGTEPRNTVSLDDVVQLDAVLNPDEKNHSYLTLFVSSNRLLSSWTAKRHTQISLFLMSALKPLAILSQICGGFKAKCVCAVKRPYFLQPVHSPVCYFWHL